MRTTAVVHDCTTGRSSGFFSAMSVKERDDLREHGLIFFGDFRNLAETMHARNTIDLRGGQSELVDVKTGGLAHVVERQRLRRCRLGFAIFGCGADLLRGGGRLGDLFFDVGLLRQFRRHDRRGGLLRVFLAGAAGTPFRTVRL